jgi:hypothetical protein
MTCSKVALVLSVLGTVGVGVTFSMGVAMGTVILYGGRLHFRSIRWRLFWWASRLTFLVGIALSALFCGFPANHLAFGLT